MELTPQVIYQQNIDKQRIVIVGAERSTLANIIISVLNIYHRKYDYFAEGKLETMSESPILLIEAPIQPDTISFKHHIVILTSIVENELGDLAKLVDATPKGGILFYPEIDPTLKAITSKAHVDGTFEVYKMISYEDKNGAISLVSSTNEKFPIKLKGKQNLLLLSVAKMLLKKIGISSGQFYKAVSELE